MKSLYISILRLYQKTLSPDHGIMKARYPHGYCRYYPSCSAYAIEAAEQYGLVTAIWLTVGRILRCNPWSSGGIDHVPGFQESRQSH